MKKFLLYLLSALAVFFVADRILALAVGWLNDKSYATDAYKVNQTVLHTEAEVIFMGSSRCHHDYVPSIISDSIGLSVFNAGLWGMRNIYYQYGVLNLLLDRHVPKVICYEAHPIDILQTPYSGMERINSLAPFVGQNNEVDSLMEMAGKLNYYRLSHLYRYNGQIVKDVLSALFVDNDQKDGGYKPLFKNVQPGEMTDVFEFETDANRMALMNRFIALCKQRGIRLIMMSAPTYHRSSSNLAMVERFDSIARSNGLDFLNYTELPEMCDSAKYFADRGHLNDTGARHYSSIIGTRLKEMLAE